jgi:hypothetical protein
MVNVEANGWFTDSALILAPLAVFPVWLVRYRPIGWLIFAIPSVLMLGSGGRGSFIFAATAISTAYLLERGRRWFDLRVAVLAVLASAGAETPADRRRALAEGRMRQN